VGGATRVNLEDDEAGFARQPELGAEHGGGGGDGGSEEGDAFAFQVGPGAAREAAGTGAGTGSAAHFGAGPGGTGIGFSSWEGAEDEGEEEREGAEEWFHWIVCVGWLPWGPGVQGRGSPGKVCGPPMEERNPVRLLAQTRRDVGQPDRRLSPSRRPDSTT
jgi:hypothetical protein